MPSYDVRPDGTVLDSSGRSRPDIAAKAGNLLPNDHRGQNPALVRDLRQQAAANPGKWQKEAKKNPLKGY